MNAPAKVEASLASAMAAAFAEIEAATKSADNTHFKSKYADLGAVIDAIKPPLVKHGLFFTQRPQPSEDGVTIETVLHHASGDMLSLGTLFVPANKKDAQGFGSAMTYARRYGLVTAFGVPTEDDDGNAASLPAPKAEPVRMATNDQIDLIMTLAPAAGMTALDVAGSYKVSRPPELTEAQAAKAINRLRELIKEKKEKEATNA